MMICEKQSRLMKVLVLSLLALLGLALIGLVCLIRPAQVSGSWGAWSGWSNCSEGGGITERFRQCDSPPPANGGEYCPGKPYETKICDENDTLRAPMDGSLGDLSDWSECSQTCGGGTQTRRSDQDFSEERQCNTDSCPVSGFIVSGGGDSKKVELFNPSNGSNCPVSCPFQDMDRIRPYHTSCSGLLCGGGSLPSTKETCVKINGTQITPLPSLTLRQERSGHLCWSLPGEETILLLGSYGRTTEIVSGSSASYSFDLPYYTTKACGIEVEDHFIVTGGTGREPLNTVAKYSRSGFIGNLANLNQGRYNHACSSYVTDRGETVLLVTGGAKCSGCLLDSTEISPGTWGASWKTLTTARLPSPRAGLRAATIENTVFIFGGKNKTSDLDTILSYNAIGKSWRPAGQMLVPRSDHAVSLFDVSRNCP